MVVGDLVGEIAFSSDCHQKKKIALELNRGTGKDGQEYAPFLRCEDCAKLQLEKDKMYTREHCEHCEQRATERKNTPYYLEILNN